MMHPLLASDYMSHPDLFVPVWQKDWTPPVAMLDFEEKYAAYMQPKGRVLSIVHRGDRNRYYPENSIEGFLSTILAGADMIELDIAITADHIPVIIHDDALLGTTDLVYHRLNGNQDLPQSNRVCDWTLEQLRLLRLTMEHGEVTPYVIPTLEDVFVICKNRCFLMLDKWDRFRWLHDIQPLIEKHGVHREVLVPFLTRFAWSLFRKSIDPEFCPSYLNCLAPEDYAQFHSWLETYHIPVSVLTAEFVPENVHSYAQYVGMYRIYGDTLSPQRDNVDVWKQMVESGINVIFSNRKPYELCAYIAQLHFGGPEDVCFTDQEPASPCTVDAFEPTKVWDMDALPEDLVSCGMALANSNYCVSGNVSICAAPGKGWRDSTALAYAFHADFSTGSCYVVTPYSLGYENVVSDWTGAGMLWFYVNGSDLLQNVRLELIINGKTLPLGPMYYTIDEDGNCVEAGPIPAAWGNTQTLGRIRINRAWSGWVGLPLKVFHYPQKLESIAFVVGNSTVKEGNILYLSEFWLTDIGKVPPLQLS